MNSVDGSDLKMEKIGGGGEVCKEKNVCIEKVGWEVEET